MPRPRRTSFRGRCKVCSKEYLCFAGATMPRGWIELPDGQKLCGECAPPTLIMKVKMLRDIYGCGHLAVSAGEIIEVTSSMMTSYACEKGQFRYGLDVISREDYEIIDET